MFRSLLTLLFVSSFIAGCSSEKPSNPDVAPVVVSGPERAPQSSLATELINIEFQETSELNSYVMKVSWPESVGKIAFKYTQGKASTEPAVAEKNELLIKVVGGIRVVLQLKSLDPQYDAEPYATIVRTPPRDFEVKGKIDLKANTYWSANRVIFYKGGTIVTHGFDFVIETKFLIVNTDAATSKGFQIITHESSEAHKVENAKEFSNSQISIVAEKAVGQLRAGMIGINGSNGASGDKLGPSVLNRDPTLNGANGSPGVSNFKGCTKRPGNGGKGRTGARGRSGESGQNGGNTGNLTLRIVDSSNFALRIVAKPGAGGSGGRGGNGGPGGRGGAAGAQDNKMKCPAASAGRNGSEGEDGPRGKDGIRGVTGAFEYSGIKDVRVE